MRVDQMRNSVMLIMVAFIGTFLFGCSAIENKSATNESVIIGINDCFYNSVTKEFRCGKPMLLVKQGTVYNVSEPINISFCGLAGIYDPNSNETQLIYIFGKSDQLIRLNLTNNETSRKAMGYFVLFRNECNITAPAEK